METRAAFAGTIGLPIRLARHAGERAVDILAASVRRHRAFLGIVLGYCAACYIAGWTTSTTRLIDVNPYSVIFGYIIGTLAAVLVLTSLLQVAITRPAGSFAAAVGDVLFGQLLSADRLANILVPLAVGPLFFSTFGSFKRLIPHINPFGWDETFMNWDAALHGGAQPWTLLQPLAGTPVVTNAIDVFYNLWFGTMFATYVWQAWSLKKPELRRQFLVSFLLNWIVIGTVLATILASAGPCYFGRITGLEDPYRPLMAYLAAVNETSSLLALKLQGMLWQNYVSGGSMMGGGISAMPSMHVAIATSMALLGWRISRSVGAAYTAFAAIIMIGSVHLGWHYAIDGYISIAATFVIWRVTDWALRRRDQGKPTPVLLRRGRQDNAPTGS